MQALIKHLLHNNLDEIVAKSILNCHCKGLHSIMLLEAPEKTIRLYIAVPGNEMDKNFNTDTYYKGEPLPSSDMSLSFHPHHCNLTLHCIIGELFNWSIKEDINGFLINKFYYNSFITQGEIGFKHIGESFMVTNSMKWVTAGNYISMPANEIHTVACHNDRLTAWFVYEGKEDSGYKPYSYSVSDLTKQNYSNLYQKPSKEQVLTLLSDCGLIVKF